MTPERSTAPALDYSRPVPGETAGWITPATAGGERLDGHGTVLLDADAAPGDLGQIGPAATLALWREREGRALRDPEV